MELKVSRPKSQLHVMVAVCKIVTMTKQPAIKTQATSENAFANSKDARKGAGASEEIDQQ